MRLNELEIKLKINSDDHFHALFEKCCELFGQPLSHLRQLDEYFDTSDRQLKQQDLTIRIRSNGEKKTIALKSPRVKLASGMTQRIELEFLSADGENVSQQLLNQGLYPNEASEKERWTFVYQDCEIVLDRLPFIGSFIEIEGPSENVINKMIALLDLSSSQPIQKNYGELITEKFQELDLPLSSICATFAKEAELKINCSNAVAE